jgi:mono/diheme cytochrome c family protein
MAMKRVIALAMLVLGFVAVAAAAEWKVPASAKAMKNPVERIAGLKAGKSLFDTNCAMCHGNTGRGDGPAGAALNPKPENLAGKDVQRQTDGELFWKISEGRGAMPPWKSLPEKDRWSLIRYIRSLAAKK